MKKENEFTREMEQVTIDLPNATFDDLVNELRKKFTRSASGEIFESITGYCLFASLPVDSVGQNLREISEEMNAQGNPRHLCAKKQKKNEKAEKNKQSE